MLAVCAKCSRTTLNQLAHEQLKHRRMAGIVLRDNKAIARQQAAANELAIANTRRQMASNGGSANYFKPDPNSDFMRRMKAATVERAIQAWAFSVCAAAASHVCAAAASRAHPSRQVRMLSRRAPAAGDRGTEKVRLRRGCEDIQPQERLLSAAGA